MSICPAQPWRICASVVMRTLRACFGDFAFGCEMLRSVAIALSAVMLRCERALASEPANGLHHKSPVGGNRLIYRLPFLREGSHFIPETWVTQSGLCGRAKVKRPVVPAPPCPNSLSVGTKSRRAKREFEPHPHAAMLRAGGAMNSGPTGSEMVSRRIRSISALARSSSRQ
jgi:hypothetical protein